MQGISQLVQNLLASQEAFCAMELVVQIILRC